MPKRIEFLPNETYRFEIEISGKNIIAIEERRKRLKRIRKHEASFLINELLSDFFANETPFTAPLGGGKWLPENQAKITKL